MIVVMDCSGSMYSNNKRETARSRSLKLTAGYNEASYYYFNDAVIGPMTRSDFTTSTESGGTRIQHALFDFFNKRLITEMAQTSKKSTEFWFITDACDSINDVDGVIKAKKECEKKYKQQSKTLYCKEFIVGGSGSCAAALKKIFGDGHFEGNDKDLDQMMKNAEEATKKADKSRNECDQIANTLNALSYSSAESVNSAMTKIVEIETKLKSIANDVSAVETSVNTVKANYQTLKSEKQNIENLANNAQTEQEIENAEDKAMDLSQKYSEMRSKLNEAQTRASNAMKQLIEQQNAATQTQTDTEVKGQELDKKREELKRKIKDLMARLNTIKNCEEANDIKKDIKSHLKTIRTLFENQGKATNGLFALQRNIMRSFSAMKTRKIEIDQMKRDVSAELSALDNMMNDLDIKRDAIC